MNFKWPNLKEHGVSVLLGVEDGSNVAIFENIAGDFSAGKQEDFVNNGFEARLREDKMVFIKTGALRSGELKSLFGSFKLDLIDSEEAKKAIINTVELKPYVAPVEEAAEEAEHTDDDDIDLDVFSEVGKPEEDTAEADAEAAADPAPDAADTAEEAVAEETVETEVTAEPEAEAPAEPVAEQEPVEEAVAEAPEASEVEAESPAAEPEADENVSRGNARNHADVMAFAKSFTAFMLHEGVEQAVRDEYVQVLNVIAKYDDGTIMEKIRNPEKGYKFRDDFTARMPRKDVPEKVAKARVLDCFFPFVQEFARRGPEFHEQMEKWHAETNQFAMDDAIIKMRDLIIDETEKRNEGTTIRVQRNMRLTGIRPLYEMIKDRDMSNGAHLEPAGTEAEQRAIIKERYGKDIRFTALSNPQRANYRSPILASIRDSDRQEELDEIWAETFGRADYEFMNSAEAPAP